MIRNYGINEWYQCFNSRQMLTLITYVEIINEVKILIQSQYELDKTEAIVAYLSLVLDRCIDHNSRLSGWHSGHPSADRASKTHALNLSWNYPEINGKGELWRWCADAFASEYKSLCALLGTKSHSANLPGIDEYHPKLVQISAESAGSLHHISNETVDAIITDPPYYGTIPYSDISDFFYVWQKRTLGDVFPDLFWSELTDKDREAVANPSRFRNMGASPEELANQDYEAKMALAFAEYYRVLRDAGVMTVQFNHKDSGAWDVLAKSLIDAGFEITASWAVSTENPQNLHQAQKNSVSSTVLLVCRKRDPNAGQAWWDDLRPDVANLVEQRAPEFEANDITGIDLYLSAFGPALNVFSRNYPILDSSGNEVRPEEAFAEARRAIANYRFRKLAQIDTAGFAPLTTWYMLAWVPFAPANSPSMMPASLPWLWEVSTLQTWQKSTNCSTPPVAPANSSPPQQRHKKRAFSLVEEEFSARCLIDALHAIITLYLEEQAFAKGAASPLEPVRRFLKSTGLLGNDLFMRSCWSLD